MTPLEVGVLGVVFLLFGAALVGGPGGAALWGAAVVVTLGGGFLVYAPGNLTLLDWTPGGVHTTPWGTTGGESYFLGHPWGGPTAGDLKGLTLFLVGGALFSYFQALRPPGYEPLLISLIAVAAGLFTFGVDNLVVLYLGLELQALSLYTLVGFYRFDEERTDSSVRYLLSGSLVSGFMLLGFARWYTLNGGFHVGDAVGADPAGGAWVAGVLLFKVGCAPFHFWSPVVYTPLEWVTLGVVLGGTKVAPWYLLVRNLAPVVDPAWWGVWWAGVASVVVGSIGGYFQTNVGGLLAYSGVVNGGYLLLLGLTTGLFGFGYYLVVYLVGTLFLVVGLSVYGDTRLLSLGWTPGLFTPLVVYYASLNVGGLPVFPGFFGKLVLLRGLTEYGLFLGVVVVGLSIVPAVYYVTAGSTPLVGSTRPRVLPGAIYPGVVAATVLGLNGLSSLVETVCGVA